MEVAIFTQIPAFNLRIWQLQKMMPRFHALERVKCSATGFNFQDESQQEAGSKSLMDGARSTEVTLSGLLDPGQMFSQMEAQERQAEL